MPNIFDFLSFNKKQEENIKEEKIVVTPEGKYLKVNPAGIARPATNAEIEQAEKTGKVEVMKKETENTEKKKKEDKEGEKTEQSNKDNDENDITEEEFIEGVQKMSKKLEKINDKTIEESRLPQEKKLEEKLEKEANQ